MALLVAIVGRPNVGKSRLFNRLIGSQKAIVHDYAGVTRDRQYGSGEWYGRHFDVVDTGGFVISPDEPLLDQMRLQAQLAMEQADIIVMVMDGREGLTPDDRAIVEMLRGSDKPVFFAINKVDGAEQEPSMLADFWQLGVELAAISAEHGTGMDNLMDPLAEFLPRRGDDDEDESPFARVAVVGKPNVGKSTLINALLGEDRLLTSDIPGTTRDSVDAMVRAHGKEYLLIDTAGLRRKRSIYEQLEEFAVMQSIRSIDRCDVALLVVDATKALSHQDKKIASVVVNRGKACAILFNKWDAVDDKDANTAHRLIEDLREVEMPFMRFAPTLTLSALTRQRLGRVLGLVDEVYEQHGRRVATGELNRLVATLIERHSPPIHRNRRLKFYYVSQVATRPPTFAFVCNYPDGVATSYRRFLENQLREHYGFVGTPIRCVFRAKRRRDLSEEGWG